MHGVEHEPRHAFGVHATDARDANRDTHRQQDQRHRARPAGEVPERARARHCLPPQDPPDTTAPGPGLAGAGACAGDARPPAALEGACACWVPLLALEVAPRAVTVCP